MAISVHTNYANLVTQNTLQSTNSALTKSMERLSTGFRINSAADDAAGLQIANRLNLQSRGLGVAMRNSQDAISMMQTAEGAMDEMTNIAYRMSDLATQAANGTYTDDDRSSLDSEFQELASELNNIFSSTSFGGRTLLSGGAFGTGTVDFQIGNTSTNQLTVNVQTELAAVSNAITTASGSAVDRDAVNQAELDFQTEADNFAQGNTASALSNGTALGSAVSGTYTDYADLVEQMEAGNATALSDHTALMAGVTNSLDNHISTLDGIAGSGYDGLNSTATAAFTDWASVQALAAGGAGIATQTQATAAIDSVSALVDALGETRASFGANINRLEHTITNLGNITENLDSAKGRIMDTDFAYESGMMSKSQMLMQSGASMLSASKMVPQLAMSLLG
ncbi:flagellin [Vibrio maritimus]|uniref:flagellin N-terminal helical domain-containing protein n=1 Tax=Vibrio maritimus TaxID=990268 RepID=UPI004069638A